MQDDKIKDSKPNHYGTIMPIFPKRYDPKAKREKRNICGKCGKNTSREPSPIQFFIGGFITRIVRCHACNKKTLKLINKLIKEI